MLIFSSELYLHQILGITLWQNTVRIRTKFEDRQMRRLTIRMILDCSEGDYCVFTVHIKQKKNQRKKLVLRECLDILVDISLAAMPEPK